LVKAVLVVFFSAMALVELDLARQIVLVGFSAFVITVGAGIIVVAAGSGRDMLKQMFVSFMPGERPSDSRTPKAS